LARNTPMETEGDLRIPQAWTVTGPSPPDQKIQLQFAVKQRNLQELHETFMSVSTPSNAAYGQHLSNQAVNDLTSPAPAHIRAVLQFLQEHGAEGVAVTPNSDMIEATVTVAQASRILSAKFVRLAHQEFGETLDRAPEGYSLPEEVAAAVDFVSPTVHIPGVRKPHNATMESAESNQNNVPKALRQLYSVGDAVGKHPANKQAVTAFLGQFYDEKSLKSFWKEYCQDITCGKGLPKLVGTGTKGRAGVESMLDIETITGISGNISSEFWGYSGSSPDNPANEPFMKWLAQMSSTSDQDIPKIFSTSYGEDESSWSLAAATRLNVEFQKAGARGISLLYAAGDEGANCKGSKFVPEGPGSSPYVTAVGGTEPTDGFPKPGSERAIGLSSGGFSGYWAQPEYQKSAVAGYLKTKGLPPASRGYNTTGRAYPDIAAQATNFCVVPFGCGVSGTSCATPAASGIFGLLNDLRMQQGKSTLGFLNPLIYANADAFFDVTSGSSEGCSYSGGGWPAAAGWDAVTGVGTPNYSKLAAVVSSLPGLK